MHLTVHFRCIILWYLNMLKVIVVVLSSGWLGVALTSRLREERDEAH